MKFKAWLLCKTSRYAEMTCEHENIHKIMDIVKMKDYDKIGVKSGHK